MDWLRCRVAWSGKIPSFVRCIYWRIVTANSPSFKASKNCYKIYQYILFNSEHPCFNKLCLFKLHTTPNATKGFVVFIMINSSNGLMKTTDSQFMTEILSTSIKLMCCRWYFDKGLVSYWLNLATAYIPLQAPTTLTRRHMLLFEFQRRLYGANKNGTFSIGESARVLFFFLGQMMRNQTDERRWEGRRSCGDGKEIGTEQARLILVPKVMILAQETLLVEPIPLGGVVVLETAFHLRQQLFYRQRFGSIGALSIWSRENEARAGR